MSTEQNPQTLPMDDNTGREANGRFAQGNTGGPGNPYARQTARLRQEMLDNVSPENIAKIIQSMVILAIGGNVPAAKLVLQYAVGKPTEAPNPDRLDQEEFNGFKEADGMYAESSKMVLEPHSQLPVSLLRGTREGMFYEIKKILVPMLKKGTRLEKEEETPIANGSIGEGAPKPNGDDGAGTPERSHAERGNEMHGGVNRVSRHEEARLPNGGNGGNRMHEPSANGKLHAVER